MAQTEMLLNLRAKLVKQMRRELKLDKPFYPIREAKVLLGIKSLVTLYKFLDDPDMHIERLYQGSRMQRVILAEDIEAIWMKQHTLYFKSAKSDKKFAS